MNDRTDSQLLRAYIEDRSEAAFAELVCRHVNLVYSAALRIVCDSHLAEDVAQSVFIALAKNAAQLADRAVLSGWLYCTAQNIAAQTVRSEVRRRAREREAATMDEMRATESNQVWEHIAPHLDAALGQLNEADRDALLLRYMEHKSAQEMARILDVSEEAAQKRVSRAVDRLRGFFAKRGVRVSAGSIAFALGADAVHPAPAGLALELARLAVAPFRTGMLPSTPAKFGKAFVAPPITVGLIAVGLLAVFGTAVYKGHKAASTQKASIQRGLAAEAGSPPNDESGRTIPPHQSSDNASGKAAWDLTELKNELRKALHEPPRTPYGVRSYPPETVTCALINFGLDRKEAFPILQEAAADVDAEVRKRAVATMGLAGTASNPRLAQWGIVGEPASEAKPLLWTFLRGNDQDLASMALSSLRTAGFNADEIPILAEMMSQTTNQSLFRYLPEAIAHTIETDAVAAAPFISALEAMLQDSEPITKFEASCALAKYEAATNPKILTNLTVALKNGNSLQQLMTLETLGSLGSAAEPTLQALLDYADTTPEKGMKDIAYKALGKIRSDLRSSFPEVQQALANEERIAEWNRKLLSADVGPQELIEALTEPRFAATAAKKLGQKGSSAMEAVSALIAALAGQDQTTREVIVDAIHQINPEVIIAKVNTRPIATASLFALLELTDKSNNDEQTALAERLEKSRGINSDWRTQEELLDLAGSIASQDPSAYRVFIRELLKADPTLAHLFPQSADNGSETIPSAK